MNKNIQKINDRIRSESAFLEDVRAEIDAIIRRALQVSVGRVGST